MCFLAKTIDEIPRYADKHQYYMFAQEHGNGNNKFALILTLLNQGCSWVFWTDAGGDKPLPCLRGLLARTFGRCCHSRGTLLLSRTEMEACAGIHHMSGAGRG